MIKPSTNRETASIRSESVEYRNAAGLRIRAFLDTPADQATTQFAVMAPKYGETKKNNLQLSYDLAANGLTVLRFDLTNHIGESEGTMSEFTLPGAVDDILASIAFLERTRGATEITLVASSLSARCAIRAAALCPRLKRLICLVGVVNLQRTVTEVYREDLFGSYLAGKRWGVIDILGFNIRSEHFMQTAIDADLHTLDGTLRDLHRMEVPIEYFYAENDVWVDPREVKAAFGHRRSCRLHTIRGAMHEVRENPRAADHVYRSVVSQCLDGGTRLTKTAGAPLNLVLAQNRTERDRLKRIVPDASDERSFWTHYFEKYRILDRSAVFQEYLDVIGRMIGSLEPGMTVLDAGCGNGLFGAWMLQHVARQRGAAPESLPYVYIGIDLTPSGLAEAMDRHVGIRSRFASPASSATAIMYSELDFDTIAGKADGARRLPFAADTFDAICCSLVVSYLRRPEPLAAELYRVLRPGGALVVSSLKPHCDLSALYRTFVDQHAPPADLAAARDLLSAGTTIRLKAEAGHYTFFDEEELAALLRNAGFSVVEAARSFGNQANVLRVIK